MITDKEKLWYGTILVATAILSTYSFVAMDKQLPPLNEALVESQGSLDDLQSQIKKQNDILLLLQTDLKTVYEYTAEKIKTEKETAAIKSVCKGLLGVSDADKQRKQNKLSYATTILKATKEPFWQAGDVLTNEQTALRGLMAPIDDLMARWGKEDKTADTVILVTAVKAVLKKIDPLSEYCPISDPVNMQAVAEKKEQPAKNDAAIKILCTSYQQLTAAEKEHQQNNLTGAATKLKTAKDTIWQASDVFAAEQSTLRNLMGPIDALIGQWNSGDKSAETKVIKESVKGIIQKAGGQPEACPSPPPEEQPKPVAQAPAPAPPAVVQAPTASAYAAAPNNNNYQPSAYMPVNFGSPAGYAPQANAVCAVKAPEKPEPQAEPCTFTSNQADYTPKGSLHCLRLSLEKISVAETKHRQGDLSTATKILQATKQIVWRSGDNLISEQPALGVLMIAIDNIVMQWRKGNEKAETTMVTAKLTQIVQRLEKTSS